MNRAMHKRTAHRWRLAIIMMVGTVFALGSFYLVQLINRDDTGTQGGALKSEPDYIVERFSFVRMTPSGQPRYIISGDKLTHRPIDDSSDVERPVVQNLSPAQQPMTMNAQRARIDHAHNVVTMRGNVDIERAASAAGKRMTLKTEELTVFPDEDRMTSNLAVDLTLGNASVHGVGMQADNAAQTVKLSSNGRIVYPPHTAR